MVRKKLLIIWDNEAKRSLRSIYDYLKTKESIPVAKKVRNEILMQSRSLGQFPEKFAEEPNLKKEAGNFRFKVIWSYKIIYEVSDETILILDIFHTSRDSSNIRRK
jgi:plasmid stabilization system protein ParE